MHFSDCAVLINIVIKFQFCNTYKHNNIIYENKMNQKSKQFPQSDNGKTAQNECSVI